MKIKTGFVLRNICDSYVVVAVGTRAEDFKGMIKLNDTGAFLWQRLQQERTREELLAAMLEEYDVDSVTAANGIGSFIDTLRQNDLLD